jgi:hypothetical protein
MHIQLQTSVGDFDASFIKELHRFEGVMEARGRSLRSSLFCRCR